jgi:hypothetical protein
LYEFDGGRDYKKSNLKYRYSAVPVDKIGLELTVYPDKSGMEINRTYYSPLIIIDSVNIKKNVTIVNKKLKFIDGTVLEQKSRPMGISAKCYDKEKKEIPCLEYYYTCNDFNKKVKKSKHLYLKVIYDIDSLGIVTRHEKEYQLVRKKYCRIAVH